jgi:hypothetical protein
MSPVVDAAQARRYLLGLVTEEERSAVEQEYFHSDETVDRIAAAEDDLIEDYLSESLDPVERELFEREYLATVQHRQRVETVRQLLASGARTPHRDTATNQPRQFQWMALAAALVLVAAGTLWIFTSSRGDKRPGIEKSPPAASTSVPPSAPGVPGQPPRPTPPAPRVFAVSISPVTVRTAADVPSVILPAGTDIVALSLEGEVDGRKRAGGRATIRTVSGSEVWQGPAIVTGDLPSEVIARLEIPAPRLAVDDYVITLLATDAGGAERELSRYFLRVRAR